MYKTKNRNASERTKLNYETWAKKKKREIETQRNEQKKREQKQQVSEWALCYIYCSRAAPKYSYKYIYIYMLYPFKFSEYCSLILEHTIKSYHLFIVAYTKIVKSSEFGNKTTREKKRFAETGKSYHGEIQMNRWYSGDKYAKMQQSERQNKVIFIVFLQFKWLEVVQDTRVDGIFPPYISQMNWKLQSNMSFLEQNWTIALSIRRRTSCRRKKRGEMLFWPLVLLHSRKYAHGRKNISYKRNHSHI